jgi:hypothetical protein
MIRFILKREVYDALSGRRSDACFTIDAEAPELEAALRSGGHGESGFDQSSLLGVEVLDSAPAAPSPDAKETERE